MLQMILQMSAATALYIAATILMWKVWHRKDAHTAAQKIGVGLFYGLCSVLSNHIGIDYGDMVLNVRDIGPLAAGLFFDPLSGILAGLIGGIERYIIGAYFGIGSFTRVACGISTILAGFLAAGLNRWVYHGKNPTVIHSLFLGAEMEVFHMYAVFITNRDDIVMAAAVVQVCALPMILFTAVGLAACTSIISRLSGSRWKLRLNRPLREIGINDRFQRWLLVAMVGFFSFGLGLDYALETRASDAYAENEMKYQLYQYRFHYEEGKDRKTVLREIEENNTSTDYWSELIDTKEMLRYTEQGNPVSADPWQMALAAAHSDGKPFRTALGQMEGMNCLCVCEKLDEDLYIMIWTPDSVIYVDREIQMLQKLFLEIMTATALYVAVEVLLGKLVLRNLDRVNGSLARITAGSLTEKVEVEESSEFAKLSEDINQTVDALRGFIDASEKRMQEDLELAKQIQDSALPKNFRLPSENIEIYATMTPAKQVGGDFYDFFYIAQDELALVIADVSGKGIPGAMFMMRSKTAIKNYARSGMTPARLLEAANNTLCEGNEAGMFVTVWLGILNLKTGVLRCSNAGHEYPVLMRAGGDYELIKNRHDLVMGMMEDIPRKEFEITLEPGDRLFVYTDGIPEAINGKEEAYGTERLLACLNALKDQSQAELLPGVLADVRKFCGGAEQFDDITMLGITYKRG